MRKAKDLQTLAQENVTPSPPQPAEEVPAASTINNVDPHNGTPLYYVYWKESIRCVELLLKMGVNIHTSRSGITGSTSMLQIRMLLGSGANDNTVDNEKTYCILLVLRFPAHLIFVLIWFGFLCLHSFF
ncbi:hypothetical protein CEXT_448361 [Caerostris extrusa]|uniref:Uncharacterized protein n=1 Tax=Caerostris extrusa TaxID=172846 RepID=A0AAV4NEC5_CAEEX|nr:hypothetical protein CEXT_448361 [Caerostris extrusa]